MVVKAEIMYLTVPRDWNWAVTVIHKDVSYMDGCEPTYEEALDHMKDVIKHMIDRVEADG